MIFQHTLDKVLSGEKTQTRRIVKPNQKLVSIESAHGGYRPLHLSGNDHILYAIGKTYAIQPGRGKSSVGRIRITDIRREDVRAISDDDVKAEGFARAIDFWETWCAMHDKAICIQPGSEKTIVSYPRINAFTVEEHAAVRDVLMLRPNERYQAWALTFEVLP